jgi:hypothetical protein
VNEAVEKSTVQQAGLKRDWALTESAFEQLLVWLGQDSEPGGERYVEMRRRLVHYFDRKNCLSPDELADETLNRVARRLEEEGTIISDTPAHYCYIVARLVFLESLRQKRRQESLDERRLSGRRAREDREPSRDRGEVGSYHECTEHSRLPPPRQA